MGPHNNINGTSNGNGNISTSILQNGDAKINSAPLAATPEMCRACFDTLIKELVPISTPSLNNGNDETKYHFDGASPLFVTWEKNRSSTPNSSSSNARANNHTSDVASYDLRGCIGTLSPRPLNTSLREYALTSAFHDRRFDPISIKEIPQLRVAVSLLVQYEECSSCYHWTVGVHGILIHFFVGGRQFSATYLPEVASDQGWTREETVCSLVKKAGYKGDIGNDEGIVEGRGQQLLLSEIQCTRYQSSKHLVTYGEYVVMLGMDPLEKGGGAVVGSKSKKASVGWSSCLNL